MKMYLRFIYGLWKMIPLFIFIHKNCWLTGTESNLFFFFWQAFEKMYYYVNQV